MLFRGRISLKIAWRGRPPFLKQLTSVLQFHVSSRMIPRTAIIVATEPGVTSRFCSSPRLLDRIKQSYSTEMLASVPKGVGIGAVRPDCLTMILETFWGQKRKAVIPIILRIRKCHA